MRASWETATPRRSEELQVCVIVKFRRVSEEDRRGWTDDNALRSGVIFARCWSSENMELFISFGILSSLPFFIDITPYISQFSVLA